MILLSALCQKIKCARAGRKFGVPTVSEPLPATLLTALADLAHWVQSENIPAVIVGGVAASLLGRPRLTRDIDALVDIDEAEWQWVLSRVSAFGFAPRIHNPFEFAKRSRVLLLRHTATDIDIDVMLSALPFEKDAIANGRMTKVADISIRLPQVEDLLIMKAIANRPRDLADIEGLIDANPGADLAKVRQWVQEFATAATLPDLVVDFDRIVERLKS